MKPQHTPGPWVAHAESGMVSGPTRGGRTLASVGQAHGNDPSELAANARLMAAAPDMLDALQAITARIQGEWDHPALLAYGALGIINEDVLAIAGTAIAKAVRS
jgi:hypothetical protein